MKTQFLLAAVAGLAAATPVAKRQGGGDELREGECQDVTFIFARASGEQGLLGGSVGPMVCDDLKSELGSVACQGVGPEYTAGLADNALPQGTTPTAIAEAQSLFEMANTKCPQTKIVAGGYSQGCAVMHGAIPDLAPEIKEKTMGVVLFGDTRNEQDGGQIPNFSPDRTKIFCAAGDLVCEGQLIVGPAHFTYAADVPEAVQFLVSNIGQ